MIRIAQPEDSSDIAALSIQVWLDTYAKQGIRKSISEYVLAEFSRQNLEQKLTSNDEVYMVSIHEGHLIGYLSLNLAATCPVSGSKIPELVSLYVQENFTANGVGSELLQSAFTYCKELEHEKVWLTVNHENLRAQKFYSKHNFNEIGVTYFELENEKHKNHVLCKSINV